MIGRNGAGRAAGRSAAWWRRLASGLLLAAVCAGPGAAQEWADRFDAGLRQYEAEEYDAARESFADALAAGGDGAAVHYNLANCHFKTGSLGPAIYHYRRALKLAPRDEDVRANLEYARFLALDQIDDEQAPTDRRVELWLDRLTPAEAFLAPMVLFVLAGLAALAWQFSPRGGTRWRRTAFVLLGLWAVALTAAAAVTARSREHAEAVVLAPEIEVRNGPGETFETAFVLHEGAEVVVEGERGDWMEISLPGDLRGWLPTDAMARL